MDNNNLLTVKEVAEITQTTHQNIYKQLSTTLKPYVFMQKNKKLLKYQVITEHFNVELPVKYKIKLNLIENSTNATEFNPNMQPDSTNATEFNSDIQPNATDKLNNFATNATEFNPNMQPDSTELINNLQSQIEYFKEQIEIKDNRITELTDKITELTDKLTVLLENSQQLQQNQQLLTARSADEGKNNKKVPLFLRIFGKK